MDYEAFAFAVRGRARSYGEKSDLALPIFYFNKAMSMVPSHIDSLCRAERERKGPQRNTRVKGFVSVERPRREDPPGRICCKVAASFMYMQD